MNTTVRTNCPRDCYDGCGILVETRDDGAIRVLGDPDHPVSRGRLCSKCAVAYNGVWLDSAARLSEPLKRVGPKGSGKFEPISWDEALELIAEQLIGIIESDGAQAILHTHYSGTLSLIANMFPSRFFTHLGATEVDPDSICNAAGHTAWHLLFGNSGVGFDPRTAKDAQCILVWGANPSHTAPHAHEHWLTESPARVVVVDPVRTESAAAADLHLQPRPGTDAALAFALLHALREQGSFNAAFIDARTVGAEEIEADINRCTPEWGEAQTGVPAADIVAAAELYGAGPSLLWCGQGLQRQATGGNVMRAVGLLPALTGNVGKPGTGFYYLNYTPAVAGVDLGSLMGASLAAERTPTVGHMELAQRLSQSDEFKAFVVWNTNPLASAPDQRGLQRACEREDLFTVVVDCFPTDSTRYADVVLPAAGFLEFDDLTFSYFHLLMGAQSKARPPEGSSLPNQEIFRRLARKMGLTEPALYETDEVLLEAMVTDSGFDGDFAQLKRRGHFYISPEPMQFYQDLKFDTPSGRIEIASAKAAKRGLPLTPQPQIEASPTSEEFRLLTPASKWRMNDSYGNDPHIQEMAGAAELIMNPRDAKRLGLADGASVQISNALGALPLQLQIRDVVPDGTVLSYKGRWPNQEPAAANLNAIHIPVETDMGGSSSVHSTSVRVSAVR